MNNSHPTTIRSLRHLAALALSCAALLPAAACTVALEDEDLLEDGEYAEEEDIGEADEALTFGSTNFLFYQGGNATLPTISTDGVTNNTITLLEDNVYNASSVAFFRTGVLPPYDVEFEYQTWDNDGGPIWNSADGVVLMLGKSTTPYSNGQTPPVGAGRGFILDGTGYGVHFAVYPHAVTSGQRGIFLQKGDGAVLQSVVNNGTYTAGAWAKVRAEVRTDGIKVFFKDQQVLSWTGAVSTAYNSIGVGAATGAADSRHNIRNLTILPVIPTTVTWGDASSLYYQISNVSVAGAGNTNGDIKAGQLFTLSMDYFIKNPSCPGCTDQILVGFASNDPRGCTYNGTPGGTGVSGSGSIQLVAPTTPGLYYLRHHYGQDTSCNRGWWSVNGTPTAADNIAAINVVQP